MEVSESNSIQAPPKRVVQEEIEDDDSQILEEGMLPSCKDKWSGMFDPYSSGFINPPKDMQPLPPFTSGDAPICSLNSSADSPIPVILISKVCFITSDYLQKTMTLLMFATLLRHLI